MCLSLILVLCEIGSEVIDLKTALAFRHQMYFWFTVLAGFEYFHPAICVGWSYEGKES